MIGVAESGIEDGVRLPMHLGESYSRTFPGRVASCGEHHAVFTLGSKFSQRPAEQLIADPGRGGMNGDPIPRAVHVVFVKERGGIIGVENVAKSSRVFGKVALRVSLEFTEDDLSDQLHVRILHQRDLSHRDSTGTPLAENAGPVLKARNR